MAVCKQKKKKKRVVYAPNHLQPEKKQRRRGKRAYDEEKKGVGSASDWHDVTIARGTRSDSLYAAVQSLYYAPGEPPQLAIVRSSARARGLIPRDSNAARTSEMSDFELLVKFEH